MAWFPLTGAVVQRVLSTGKPAVGYVLKPYAAGTSTPISFATDATGGTTAGSAIYNANGDLTISGNVIIPHVDQNFRLALYPSQSAADSNTGAIWTTLDIDLASIGYTLSALGVTATAAELNILDGATITTPQLNDIANKVVGPASSIDNEIVLFDGTSGKLLKRSVTSGILKADAGVIGPAISGTDIKTLNGQDLIGAGNISFAVGLNPDYQEFTSSGTWTKPAGVTMVYVEGIGAGGSGGASNGAGATDSAGGGGGGLFVDALFRAADLSASVIVTVGAGGSGVATGNAGNDGGDTSFGTHLTAPGGGAGEINSSFALGGLAGGLLGIGGSVTAGATNQQGDYAGGAGGISGVGTGDRGGNAVKGGAGGGAAGTGASGAGGTSLQAGNGGAGSSSGNGTAGTAPGGGGGASSNNGSTSGAGAAGRLRVWSW